MERITCLLVILSLCGCTNSSVFDTISSYYCEHYECCSSEYVPFNIKSLKTMLNTKLYGQHIAADIVLNAVISHVRISEPKKPLVMSFQGPNGVGKTYVSRMIAKAFFKKGDNSQFFHFYYGLDDFPVLEKMSDYQVQLKREIEIAINGCDRALFVFDGVDSMPPGLLDVLMPFIDCRNCVGKTKKNKSIFIFLTNTGSVAIQNELLKKYKEGVDRQSTTLKDFQRIIMDETFNRNGGLFESIMIKSDAIDFHVPFLPLEKEHVKYCIKEALEELKTVPTKDLIKEVFQELIFGPEPENRFSHSGCKRVSTIAGRIVAKKDIDFDDFNSERTIKTEL